MLVRVRLSTVFRLLLVWLPLGIVTHVEAAELGAQRIVTLAPNLTELVYAAGAGDRIVGTVDYSDFPDAARRIPRIGDAFRVDNEKILALNPDLVLAWETGTPRAVIEKLDRLGLRVETIKVSRLNEVGTALRQIGKLTGTDAAAWAAATDFEARITALKQRYEHRWTLRVFIEINRQPLFTVNGQHIVSDVVKLCGGKNIFENLNQIAPSVSVEAVVVANPDVILATVGTEELLRDDWRRWTNVIAVRRSRVFNINSDPLVRAAPRLVQGAEEVCRALDHAREK